MITVRKSEARGHANHGWLDSYHTFSFADYYDPKHMAFRSLRVINEDVVAGGGGFGMHPHRDMEIITYVISGALRHGDSMGHTAVMKAGDVQRISAGSGIQHSEQNWSPVDPVHLLQIWIMPNKRSVTPRYGELPGIGGKPGPFTLVASPEGRNGSLPIHADADLYLAKLEQGISQTHTLAKDRHAWIQVAEGEIEVNGQRLEQGDGAAVSGESALTLSASQKSQVLVFDLA